MKASKAVAGGGAATLLQSGQVDVLPQRVAAWKLSIGDVAALAAQAGKSG